MPAINTICFVQSALWWQEEAILPDIVPLSLKTQSFPTVVVSITENDPCLVINRTYGAHLSLCLQPRYHQY